ncbi:MAG: bifunctional riboflavin kinase/FAD synthetase [Demequinaceae bacterium]|nr:bifunctional riboflavin kinase/FAD synthetase [Demequinaceae bacterium]
MTTIWHSLVDVPADGRASVVTLGNFDGVHRGHQAVLTRVAGEARACGERSVAITFDPHPLAVHRPESPPTLITGIEDRLERMGETGLDAILVIPYSLEIAAQTGEEFVRAYIAKGLRASGVVIGHDTKFGHDDTGHVDKLREFGGELGFTVEVLEWEGASNGAERRWSSTWIRELLEAGRVAEAAEILGRPHRVRGTVVHGGSLGHRIGFPTANLDVYAGMIPSHGVYAAWLSVLSSEGSPDGEAMVGRRFAAAVSLGRNLTVGETDLRLEAYLPDAPDFDIYGARVALDFIDRRRDMMDFGSIEALQVALGEDVAWLRETLPRP